MNTSRLIRTVCPSIGNLGSAFYFAPPTVERGEKIGLDAARFYFLGRGGVLGDVEAPVVLSAFGYFEPGLVTAMWDSGRKVVAPREAARAFFEACHHHGRLHLADVPELDGFCDAAQRVIDAADPSGLSLFAGVRAEPMAEDLPARAMQQMTVLRELRGSAHLLAVVASGIEPKVAHYIRRPDSWQLFGYNEDPPATSDDDRAALRAADRLTDDLLLNAYGAVDEKGADMLVRGLERIEAAFALGA